jgi:sterol desaturase/sphingolipid hydroxylase (fatty acid hydroxylase superfamily)
MDEGTITKVLVFGVLLILGIIESFGGLYWNDRRTKNDFTIEFLGLFLLPTFIQPGIFLIVLWVSGALVPNLGDALIESSIFLQIAAFLVFDDMTQYWWHRLSHVNRKIWKLHRPHHVVEEMGVLVTYRNAVLYYAFMPGIWFSAFLVYLGMGQVYLFYLPIKLIIILLAHSETKWDQYLYRYKLFRPLAWVVERTISTPSTHFAHHGLTAEDGVSHPNGNYGNLLFIWDIIFGTAKITRKYPSRFGAWNQIKEPWYVQLFFPLMTSKDERSELHSIVTKNDYDPSLDFKEFSK